MINFRLKVFYSVAISLNFTKAAEDLFITQPAVTKNIKELETELDIRLFDRIKGKVYLTEAGSVLLGYVNKVKEFDDKLNYDLSVLKNRQSGHLRIGASTTIGQYVLPAILAQFKNHYPDIDISLYNENTNKIEQVLADREIELGMVEGKSKNSQLKYIPFIRDEIVVVAHTSQVISQTDEISSDELMRIPIVLREPGSGSLDIIIDKLEESGLSLKDLNVVMHLGSTESIKSYLANSNTISLISINAVSKEIANGEFKVIDIRNMDIIRTFDFVHLHGKLSGLGELFIQFAQNTITKGYRV